MMKRVCSQQDPMPFGQLFNERQRWIHPDAQDMGIVMIPGTMELMRRIGCPHCAGTVSLVPCSFQVGASDDTVPTA